MISCGQIDLPAHAHRDSTFDAVKGGLVLLMVVYHVMSISSTAGTEAYRYIRFISGSFILVSGFILSRFVAPQLASQPGAVSLKLAIRGVKLLLLFSVLNVAIHASGFGNLAKRQVGVAGFLATAGTVYISGDGRASSFVILLPIAYLLVIAPALLIVAKWAGQAYVMLATALFAVLVIASPGASVIVQFMLIGVCGMCAGSLSRTNLRLRGGSMSGVVAGLGLCLSLWFTGRYADNLVLHCIGVCLVLKCLHDVVQLMPVNGEAARQASLLGRYSLVCYIAQIGMIQVMFRLTGSQRLDLGFELVGVGLLTGTGMILLCRGLEHLRHRSRAIDLSYRAIFL